MSLTPPSGDGLPAALDRIAIPIGLAVLTWLALLLTVGFFARLGSFSLLNLFPLLFVALLFWPVYRVEPWREGTTERVVTWVRHRRVVFPVVVGLALVPLAPAVPDLLVSVLQLPYRGSGIFYGASLFYRERFGPTVARLLLVFAQAYLQALWLYFLSVGLVGLARRLR